MRGLNSYASNGHSQGGEDGIILEAMRRISESGRRFDSVIAFGAGDGKRFQPIPLPERVFNDGAAD